MSKREHDDDPIGDYVEWTEHRYDPGHYLGGNVSPFLRKSRMSPRVRRLASVPLGISALFATVGAFQALDITASRLMWLWSAAVAILLWWATIAMFRSGRRTGHDHHRYHHKH